MKRDEILLFFIKKKFNNEQLKKFSRLIAQIREWAESSSSYLSERTPYSSGYKDAVILCKERILEILNR